MTKKAKQTTRMSEGRRASASAPERKTDVKIEEQPQQSDFPLPQYVAEVARGETNHRLVADYAEAIQVLRDEKRFTFREIADWLTERFGIEADHNAVYRAYAKGMSDGQAAAAAMEDEADERESTL